MAFTCMPDEGLSDSLASLPAATRPAVEAFHRFARACDRLARDAEVPVDVRRAALAAAEAELAVQTSGRPTVAPLLAEAEASAALRELCPLLLAQGLPLDAPRRMLQAVERDLRQRRCRNWSDLMLLCSFRDAPLGRFLIDLHGEDAALRRPAEALAIARRCLALLADCRDDYRRRDHVYLPLDWLAKAGVDEKALGAPRASRALRTVFRRYLDRVDEMLVLARPLGDQLASPELREAAWTAWLGARRLARRLRRRDPLARPVELPGWERRLIRWLARVRARRRTGAASSARTGT